MTGALEFVYMYVRMGIRLLFSIQKSYFSIKWYKRMIKIIYLYVCLKLSAFVEKKVASTVCKASC